MRTVHYLIAVLLLVPLLSIGSYHLLVITTGERHRYISGQPDHLRLHFIVTVVHPGLWSEPVVWLFGPLAWFEERLSTRTLAADDPLAVRIEEVLTADAGGTAELRIAGLPLAAIHALAAMPPATRAGLRVEAYEESGRWMVELRGGRRIRYAHDGRTVRVEPWGYCCG